MGVVKSGRGIEDSMGSLPGRSFASNCNTDTSNIGPSPNLGPMQGALHMGPLLRGTVISLQWLQDFVCFRNPCFCMYSITRINRTKQLCTCTCTRGKVAKSCHTVELSQGDLLSLKCMGEIQWECTAESHNYAPPLCMLASGKRGLLCVIVPFTFADHYQPANAMRVHDLCTFSGCLMSKTWEATA